MPDARVVEVVQAVEDLLAGNINPAEAIPESAFSTNERIRMIAASAVPRKVRIHPIRYWQADRPARKRVENAYMIHVSTTIPYPEPANSASIGRVPADWIEEQIAWHEQNVYALLNETGVHLDETDPLDETLRPFSCETIVIFDEDALDANKVFFSVTEVEYRETVRG